MRSFIKKLFEGEQAQLSFDKEFEDDSYIRRTAVDIVVVKHIPRFLKGESSGEFLIDHLIKKFGAVIYERSKNLPTRIIVHFKKQDKTIQIFLPIGQETGITLSIDKLVKPYYLSVVSGYGKQRNKKYTTKNELASDNIKQVSSERMLSLVNKTLKKYGYEELY